MRTAPLAAASSAQAPSPEGADEGRAPFRSEAGVPFADAARPLDGEPGPFDEEPGATDVPFLASLPQFFVFPLILVATLTVIYLGLRVLGDTGSASASEALAAIRASQAEHSQWQALHALADDLAKGRVTLDDVGAPELAGLYADLAPRGPRMREFLLQVVKFKRGPELTAVALGALEDEDAQVRLSALAALKEMGDPQSAVPLADVLRTGSEEERFFALGALASLGTVDAREAIAPLLDAPSSLDRRNAALALATAGDRRALPHLEAMLERASYERDPALLGAFGEDYAPESRAVARANLTEAFLSEACAATVPFADVTALDPLLARLRENDPSIKVRSAAIDALLDRESARGPIANEEEND